MRNHDGATKFTIRVDFPRLRPRILRAVKADPHQAFIHGVVDTMLSVERARPDDLLLEAKRQRLSPSDASSSDEADDNQDRRVTRDLRRALEETFLTSRPLHEQKLPLREGIVALRSPEGLSMLTKTSAGSKRLFCSMAPFFEGQATLGCGTCSLAVGLNTMHSLAKGGQGGRAEQLTTQVELREELRKAVKPEHRYFSSTLQELVRVGSTRAPSAGCRLRAVRSIEGTSTDFRADAVRTIEEGGCVLVNFSRTVLGYKDSPYAGHVSPIGAYHEATDSFLMMDVAIESYPCCWVPSELLFRGMLSMDQPRDARSAAVPRGYLLLSPDTDTGSWPLCVECEAETDE